MDAALSGELAEHACLSWELVAVHDEEFAERDACLPWEQVAIQEGELPRVLNACRCGCAC